MRRDPASRTRRKLEIAEQRSVIASLRRDAARLATVFRLPLRSIDAESPRVKRRYGICYDDGSIRIRLRHVRTGRILKYSALVDTLCHELAHLRHFDHGPRFKEFYLEIQTRARQEGIYRPAPRVRTVETVSLLDVRAAWRRRRVGGGVPPGGQPEPGARGPLEPEAPSAEPVQLSLF